MAPPVSVIIPALNEEADIGACLASLSPLRAAGGEIIVADGGSTDATGSVAGAHGAVMLTATRGRASQMNAGAARAKGELLVFLHADSRLTDAACTSLLATRPADTWGRLDLQFDEPAFRFRLLGWMIRQRSRITGIATGDQGIFVSRVLFERAGGYPAIPLMEDVALSKILRRMQRPLCLHARIITSARRWRERGYLRTILLMWRLRLGYFFGENVQRLAARYR